MKAPIEDRLQASVNMDAVNGDSIERSVVGLQIQEAIYEIRKLRNLIKELESRRCPICNDTGKLDDAQAWDDEMNKLPVKYYNDGCIWAVYGSSSISYVEKLCKRIKELEEEYIRKD